MGEGGGPPQPPSEGRTAFRSGSANRAATFDGWRFSAVIPFQSNTCLRRNGFAAVHVTVILSWLGHAHLDTTNLYAQGKPGAEPESAGTGGWQTARLRSPLVGSAMPIYWLGSIGSEAGINMK